MGTFIMDYFICIIDYILLGKVVFLGNIVCVDYRFISICDVTHRTSEAGNGETGPSTLSSLVGNFPCMPQSPTFTHSPEGLGPSFPKAFNPAHTPHSLSTGPELLSLGV